MKIIYIIWNITPKIIKSFIFKKYLKNKFVPFGTFPLTHYIKKYIVIGDYTYIGKNCELRANIDANIIIGKYCSIASGCKMITFNHSINYPSVHIGQGYKSIDIGNFIKKSKITIGNDVWLGYNVIILPGVNIGDGAIVGAGSIVTKNIPAYNIYAGNPAKLIKKRFNEKIIKKLEKKQWWNWDKKKILKNKDFFNTTLN